MDEREARRRLAAAVPPNVRAVCATLTGAGHQAVTVGGAVRDAIIGRSPGDWDVATSARPDEVMALFPKTVPTGLAHGTVTIVTGRGEHTHVEVTTFRGEGAYTDARRPDHVIFGVPLVEDLARRDFRINAMAYDPASDALIDPYAGMVDLAERKLRAVGPTGKVYDDAVARFTEDGLRVMRAVRFAAVLEFDLDLDTERGIVPALPSLAKVSKERVSAELRHLLGARQPSRGLAIAERTGIIALIVPELAAGLDARAAMSGGRDRAVTQWLARIDAAPIEARLAAFVVEIGAPGGDPAQRDSALVDAAQQVLRRLKFSNQEADSAAHAASIARAMHGSALAAPQIRRLFAAIGRDHAANALAVWRAMSADSPLVAVADQILRERDPLAVKDLAVTGKDVMDELEIAPGPMLGRTLAAILERVLDRPELNTRDQLLGVARQIAAE
ncbi:MAG: CCA tRNA nucleotidyltransferase [Kofleriaceae bacterium]